MIRNKMAHLWCQSPTATAKSFSKGFGVDLTHAKGIYKLAISASASTGPVTGEPYKTKYVGNPREDGLYEFPLHCHGECVLSGEEFATAVLAAAEKSSLVTASLNGNILTYSSKSTVALLPAGKLRGATGEIFTIMFRVCAPQNTGSSLSSGVSLAYSYGTQSVSYSGEHNGETVQMIANSNASKQLTGLSLSTTSGLPREMDISSFGIFRGTVEADAFEPYWGETISFCLAEPLRSFYSTVDIAYPLQGYAKRMIKATPFCPESATIEDISASYPVYRLPLPEELYHKELRMDRFYISTSESMLTGGALRYMVSPEGESILVTANTADKTVEKFLNYFNSYNVNLISARSEPLIERFPQITLPTRKGRNYVELQTEIAPLSLQFTYL